jgi:hypothetical protein
VKWTFTRKTTKKRMFFNAGLWIDKYRQYIVLGWYTHVTNFWNAWRTNRKSKVFLKIMKKIVSAVFVSRWSAEKSSAFYFSFFIFRYSVLNEFQKLVRMCEPPYYNTWKETNRGWFFVVVVRTQLSVLFHSNEMYGNT